MKVSVEPYSPDWPKRFLELKEQLQDILKDVPIVSIEHIGSTSIPSLQAKPVIDIDIIISLSLLESGKNALIQAGFTDCGEMGISGRVAFREPGYGRFDDAYGGGENLKVRCRYHTYLVIEGCTALRNHLDVRRVLLGNPSLREEYGQVKSQLAEKELENIDEYVRGKTAILCKILREAGWSEEELEPVIKANE
ncbi:uncharacterized protein N7483_007157 [Penicillium malachiteum]|uniref:uncharacterized protein n=1 Tax=Penicillium malachiteum TaxID=1324776 RepID=UPI00254954B1|nr:uncharacterized protein N7483_007157 [Penicillium malachiteum]KAJ5725800.1 hypothetical protein N7483_007157 [Penicillium malachiteum]